MFEARHSEVGVLLAGNAGFETADNIVGSAAYIHMASRYEGVIPLAPCGGRVTMYSAVFVFTRD